MNCMLIGGGGFIGAYVAQTLLKEGHKVVAYDMGLSNNTINRLLSEDELAQVSLVPGDVTDLANVIRAIREHDVDSLVHLAYWQIPASHNNPTKAIEINALGFNNTLEAMSSLGLRRLVWISSNAVFGSPKYQEKPSVPNDAFQRPNTVYGALKSLNEYMAEHYFANRGVDSIGIRLCLVYGYGRMRGASTFASDMIVNAAIGEPCEVGTGDVVVDWYYVEDAAHLIVHALNVPTPPTRVYNTHSDLRSVREAAGYLMSILPDAQLDVLPGTIDANWDLDATLLEKELGFKPKYSLEDGMRDTVYRVREKAGLPPAPGVDAVRHYSS
jgi:UDP-glucose 4-epimerase